MDVVSYIETKVGPQRDLLIHLHHVIMEAHPQMCSKIRFKIPFYNVHSWICYFNPQKNGGVELVFIKGNRIPDPFNILDAKNRSIVKGIGIQSVDEFPTEEVHYYLLEAIGLDEADYLAKQK